MIRQLIIKVLLFVTPVMAIFILYVAADPFKVLRTYESYYESGGNNYVNLNKDYISTENFLQRYPALQYSNFILGNSRSVFYKVSTWSSLIGQPQEKCYHFDASGENLYGVAGKIKFLDQQKVSINHVIVVVDYVLLEGTENQKEYFRRKHPATSGDHWLSYHSVFLKAFFNYAFLKEYIPVRLFSAKPSTSKEAILQPTPMLYNAVTNEQQMEFLEKKIRNNAAAYYTAKKDVFYKRNDTPVVSRPVLGKAQQELLQEMKTVFTKHKTQYKIIISPLYDQIELAKEDLRYLQSLFGAANVYDFSGKNSLTEPIENFYESSHYRPHVADTILHRIYKRPNE